MRISDWSSDVCSSDLGKTSELDRRAGIEHPPELLEQVGLRLLPPISTRRRIGKVVALEIERQAIERAALGESVGKLRVHHGFGGVARHLLAEAEMRRDIARPIPHADAARETALLVEARRIEDVFRQPEQDRKSDG